MRNKSAAVQGGLHSRRSKSTADLPNAAATARVSPATRVGLLAPGGPASLPPLDEVHSQYSFYTGKKLLFKLCQNLVEEGLATTRSWEKSKANPLAFVDESLRRWCFLRGLSRIEEEFSEFSVAIRDADDQKLRISVQHWHIGQLVCRAPLTALEGQATGLGAAFYQLLAYTLVRSLGSWDLDDATASVEQMKEWVSESREEEGGVGDEFEIPDLDGCTPTFIAEAREKHVSIRHSLRILRAHSKGRFGVWIKSLLRMYALSCIPIDKRLKQDPEEEGYDYLRPVPATVLSFDEQDAVVATVDEELENWSQCSSPPLLNLKFDPFQPQEMREVWRILRINFEIALETASLAEKWRIWTKAEEKKNEHRHRNRGQLSGRAA
jgi:hypothetical protein